MAPAYKLTYFDVPSAAEPVRYLFSYAGIEFEDCRIPRDKWPEIKPTMPFGLVPILEHNGKIVSQSKAICRYIAQIAKLDGKDDWENLEIDEIVDTFYDFRTKFSYWREPDEKRAKQQREQTLNEFIPFYMSRLNTILEKKNGFFVGGRLTWADIYVVSLLDILSARAEKDIAENYPNIQKLREYVRSIDSIKKYLAKRPKFP